MTRLEQIPPIETCALPGDWQMRSANYMLDCNDTIAAGHPHYAPAT
jgi:hypothetical protein